MFRRTRWFSVGVVAGMAAGAGSAVYGYVRFRETQGRLSPDRVAETMVGGARAVVATGGSVRDAVTDAGGSVRDAVADAVAEARIAMADAEARIAAELDGPPRNGDGSLERAQ